MSKRHFGWIPQFPDRRDFKYSYVHPVSYPTSVDLRSEMPPVYNQKELSSCTANAIATAIEFDHIKQGLGPLNPSRLFIYFNERSLEGTVRSDSGAMIRDGIKTIASQGVCPESCWPYLPERFDMRPYAACYAAAKEHKAIEYRAITPSIDSVRTCLAEGFPIIFGMTVYESFKSLEVEKSGVVPMPDATERVLGGHCVLCVGYLDDSQELIVQNSWGPEWGLDGFFLLPYFYMSSGLTADYWTIRVVR